MYLCMQNKGMKNPYLEQYRREMLRPAQLKQLEMLKIIAGICDRHAIDYWLDGGTLLGAVRHGGFIPWDDDIDISMRREDLERFVRIAPKELPPSLVLQTPETDPAMPARDYKVRDLNSYFVEATDDNGRPYQKGLFIDIFPFVNYPDRLHGLTRRVARGTCVARKVLATPRYLSLRAVAEYAYFSVKLGVLRLAWAALQPLCRKGTYTCSLPAYNWYGTIYRTDSLFPLGSVEFEGVTFRAPGNTDAYLKSIYGNYMQLPPPEKRAVHSLFIVPVLTDNKKDTV